MKKHHILKGFLLFLFINISVNDFAQADIGDSLALVDLYNSTNGQQWYNSTNWLSVEPVKKWYGIGLINGRVSSIDLNLNNLVGILPVSLGNLAKLKVLNLFYNHINGNIPSSLPNLSKLEYLNLGLNQLTGNIPAQLGNLTNLTSLLLGSNQFSGSIPVELGKLTNLQTLGIGGDSLNGSIPAELGKLTNLQTLSIGGDSITGSLSPDLGNLINLQNLTIVNTSISGSIPVQFGSLTNLGYLNLSYNQLTGSIPPEIGKLVNLDYIDLSHNLISGSIPPEVGNLSNVTRIEFSYNKLSGNLPAEFSKLPKLHQLYLHDNELSGSIPPEFGNFITLWWLDLDYNQLSGNIPPELGDCISLTTLKLAHNKLSGSIPKELGKLTGLAYNFDVSYNQLTGSVPSELSELGSGTGDHILAGFDISNNLLSGIIPPELENLTYTSIYLYNNNFTFNGLEYLLQHKYPDDVHYNPQSYIPLHQTGAGLSVSAGGAITNNTYKWFMVGSDDSVVIFSDSVFYPLQSGKYYAAVNNTICKELTLYTDTIDFSHVLPVTIVNLRAEKRENIIIVDWTTVEEININRYEIQRSSDETEFITIGSLTAKKNGSIKNDYAFNDVQPLKGNNYYRIKVFDKDGKITYSSIVLINIINNEMATLVYPVPAKNILYIQTNKRASFSLINQTGKVLITIYIDGKGSMNIEGMVAGIYYLKNNETGKTQKIFITQ